MKTKRAASVTLSPCQIVAWNLENARRARGWSQDEAARRLEPYLGYRMSRAAWSKAERSLDGGQIRRFDADELVAFARVFGVPVSYFLWPPEPHFKGKRVVVNSKPGLPHARVSAPALGRDELTRFVAHALAPPGLLDDRRVYAVLAKHQEMVTRQAVRDFLRDHPDRWKEIGSGGLPSELREYFQKATVTGAEEDRLAREMLGETERPK